MSTALGRKLSRARAPTFLRSDGRGVGGRKGKERKCAGNIVSPHSFFGKRFVLTIIYKKDATLNKEPNANQASGVLLQAIQTIWGWVLPLRSKVRRRKSEDKLPHVIFFGG